MKHYSNTSPGIKSFICMSLMVCGLVFISVNPAWAGAYDDTNLQARDAETFRENADLTNSCIESGGTKSHCVCVTTILKHELNLREYKAAVKLFAAEKNPEATAITATKMSLKTQQYSDREITGINALQRKLVDSDGFNQRCTIASAYFTQPTT